VEYHKIAKKEARWDRSQKKFKGDLQRLYDLGFRPTTLTAYLDVKMDLPPGASPVVFTFDDSHPSQFRLMPDGTVDPDCAVGIWQAFAAEHPDFPVRATFYIIPPTPWGQKELVARKMALLREWGCEIGSHTYSHVNLGKLSDAAASEEMGRSVEFIRSAGFEASSIALPYGVRPKNQSLLDSFNWNGKRYRFRAALLVGAGPAPDPFAKTLRPSLLPRIQSIEGDYGLTYWLNQVEKGKVKPFVAP
jgi:hypothetical protein